MHNPGLICRYELSGARQGALGLNSEDISTEPGLP
jgi:hypothetical protein